jgi:peptidoglycan/xylan/chitin deacetylase (PgdA/CDA1 family)
MKKVLCRAQRGKGGAAQFATGGEMATEARAIEVKWPKEVRLPLVMTFEHESGESAQPRPGGHPQAGQFGQMEYGARRGIWNILELLEKLGVKGTFFVNGVTAEKFPEGVRAAHAAGHEIAGLGYNLDRVRTASREREEAIVRRAAKTLSDVCGAQISGWRCPDYRPSPQTFEILAAEGFAWDSTMLNDDVPYIWDCESKPLVEIPFTTSTAEKAHVAFPYPVRGGPSGAAAAWNNEFDVLYRESEQQPRFLILSLTTWAIGRPTPLRALRQFLERVIGHNDIQSARCADIANWCAETVASRT